MASTTPEGLEIRPRHLDFDLPDPMPRHWHSGDAFKTHMFNAMSVLFPMASASSSTPCATTANGSRTRR